MNSFTHPELAESHGTHLREGYVMGCVPAVVTNVKDPLKAGRIKCVCELFDPYTELPSGVDGWIPVVTTYVNTNRSGGKLTPLSKGSQVLLIPILGKPDNWICLGAIHSVVEPPDPIHDRATGSYGEVDPSGIIRVTDGSASEITKYPQGVTKQVSADGDVMIDTPNAKIAYMASGNILIENPAGTMSIAPDGHIALASVAGGGLDMSVDGTVKMKSGHESTMVFGAGAIDIVGPKPAKKPELHQYAENISTSFQGIGGTFGELQNIDFSSLNAKNIGATVGLVKNAITQTSQIAADFQSARDSVDRIVQLPLGEMIANISPQATAFIEGNLQRIIPEIQSGIDKNLDTTALAGKINGLIPGHLAKISPGEIEPFLTTLKHDRDRQLEAIIGMILPFESVQNIFGSGVGKQVGAIDLILTRKPPQWAKDSVAVTDFLFTTKLADLSDELPELSYLKGIEETSITKDDLRKGLGQVRLITTIDKAVVNLWKLKQSSDLKQLLTGQVDPTQLDEIVRLALADPTTEVAIARIAAEVQRFKLAAQQDSNLPIMVEASAPMTETLESFDAGDYAAGVYSGLLLGINNPLFFDLNQFSTQAIASNDEPILRNRIGNYQQAMAELTTRQRQIATKEDALCKATLNQLLDKLTKVDFGGFEAEIKDDKVYYTLLKIRARDFVRDTAKSKLTYPKVNLLWDDLIATIDFLVATERRLDEKTALTQSGKIFRAEQARLAKLADKTSRRGPIDRPDYKPDDRITSARLDGMRSMLADFVSGQKLLLPDESVGCSQFPFFVWTKLEQHTLDFGLQAQTAVNNSAKSRSQADKAKTNFVYTLAEKKRVDEKAGADADTLLTFDGLRKVVDLFKVDTAEYAINYPTALDIAINLAQTIEDWIDREKSASKNNYFDLLAQSSDPLAIINILDPGVVGTATFEQVRTEFDKIIALKRENLYKDASGLDYAQSVLLILDNLQVTISNWIKAWQRVSQGFVSSQGAISFPVLADLKAEVNNFINAHTAFTSQFPSLNLFWDDIQATVDYLVTFRNLQPNLGTNQIDRSYSSLDKIGLPGTFQVLTTGAPEQPDWLTSVIAVVKAISDGILAFVPEYQDWHDKASQVLNAIPVPTKAPTISLGRETIDLKSDKNGAGSNISLQKGGAVMSAAGGKSKVDLGSGSANISTGGGAALALAAGSGSLSVGAGKVDVNPVGAILGGPGTSVFAGAGAAGFSTPFGTFGLGGGGGGGGGGEDSSNDYVDGLDSQLPVRFRVRETDLDGGSVEFYLNGRTGAGMASYDAYTGRRNAQINLFDGKIIIQSFGLGNFSNHRIEVSEAGVLIDGYSLSALYSRYDDLDGRFQTLAALVATLS